MLQWPRLRPGRRGRLPCCAACGLGYATGCRAGAEPLTARLLTRPASDEALYRGLSGTVVLVVKVVGEPTIGALQAALHLARPLLEGRSHPRYDGLPPPACLTVTAVVLAQPAEPGLGRGDRPHPGVAAGTEGVHPSWGLPRRRDPRSAPIGSPVTSRMPASVFVGPETPHRSLRERHREHPTFPAEPSLGRRRSSIISSPWLALG